MDEPAVDYAAVFAAAPTASILLTPDRFVVVDVNPSYLRAVGLRREELVGRVLFDAFPANPDAPGQDGPGHVRSSLERVIRTGTADALPPQRYDVRDVTTGGFVERYWSIVTIPILGSAGDVVLLLHKVEDLTPFMAGARTGRSGADELDAAPQPDPFAAEVLVRARELREAFLRMRDLAERERQVALVLQQSFLTPPSAPGDLAVEVRYHAAAAGSAVGGDWYDVFAQPDGSTVVTVGDVTGHDAVAAAQMGQLRALVRAIAYDSGAGPARTLERADRAAQGLVPGVTATAVVVRLGSPPARDADGGRVLTWSSAGHLPALALRRDGSVDVLAATSEPILGVVPEVTRTEHTATLADGDTLLLYTDGLVERRDEDLDDSLALLVRSLHGLEDQPLDAVCDAVLRRMAARPHEDDVVLVAVRPVAGRAPGTRPAGASAPVR